MTDYRSGDKAQADELESELATTRQQLLAAQERIAQLEKDNAESESQCAALLAKVTSLSAHKETCGCSYDKPDDICMHHSPRLLAAQADIKRLRDALMSADRFITNGIELGFIRMPDDDVPDPAKLTPGIVKDALSTPLDLSALDSDGITRTH